MNPDPSQIRLIVFDLDGTLVNAFGDIQAAVNHALAQMDRPPLDLPTVRSYVGNGVEMLMRRVLQSDDQQLVQRGIQFWKDYAAAHPADHTELYPGAVELLDHLARRGIKRAVLSNKVHEVSQAVMERLGVAERLNAVWGDRGLHAIKPHPEALLALIGELGENPEQTLVVGDFAPDIQVAKAAGAWSCGVTWGMLAAEELHALGADMLVNSFNELQSFFE